MTAAALLLAVLSGAFQAAPAAAPPPAPAGRQAAPDSAELRDRARDAQADFERQRRRWLPVNRDWPGGGTCDEVVGRICLRYGEGSDWYLEPEDARIGEARAQLLDVLTRAGEAIPGDGWILGQRVFYLVEADSAAAAAGLAERCGGVDPWWCRALAGYALHQDGRFEASAAAFRAALEAMDPERAGLWRDPMPLLDGDGRDALERAAEEGRREAAARRLWDLVDPLYLAPGNDRWTSHMSRHVVATTRSSARTPWTISWGPDMAELTLRYGWEVGWELQDQRSLSLQDRPGVVGHHDPEARVYLPQGDALLDPAASSREAWGTGRQEARSAHAPAYAPVTLPGAGQVVSFLRGDRLVVVAAQTLPEDTTFHDEHDHPLRDSVPVRWRGRPPQTGLFLVPLDGPDPTGPDPVPAGAPGLLEVRRRGTSEGVLTLDVPAGAYLVSAETWSPAERRAGRIRRGLRAGPAPPDVPTLSGFLLLSSAGEEGESLATASARALHRSWIRVGEPLVIGWEVFGLGHRPETLAYSLTVRDEGGNILQRAGRFLGLLGDAPERGLAWQEEGPATPGPVFRSVSLDLPGLGAGTCLIRLELTTQGRSTIVIERSLEIRENAGPGS